MSDLCCLAQRFFLTSTIHIDDRGIECKSGLDTQMTIMSPNLILGTTNILEDASLTVVAP